MPMLGDDATTLPLGPAIAAVGATTAGLPTAAPGAPTGRASHVLLFNAKREVLLRRAAPMAGIPHGVSWTTAIISNVDPGESYATAATRAARALLGPRVPTLRFVGKTWCDDETSARTFLGVFAAAIDHAPAPEGPDVAWIPIQHVMRALRHAAPELDAAFARSARLIMGDDDW